jgi:hypothetical protein
MAVIALAPPATRSTARGVQLAIADAIENVDQPGDREHGLRIAMTQQ